MVIGVKINVKGKLSQLSPSKRRGGTASFIDGALEVLRCYANKQIETLMVTLPQNERGKEFYNIVYIIGFKG